MYSSIDTAIVQDMYAIVQDNHQEGRIPQLSLTKLKSNVDGKG